MTAPDPILEAAARAWDRAALDHEWGTCPCALCDRDGAVPAILTAVRPLIEAEVRERVAYVLEAKAAQAAPWSDRRKAFVDAAVLVRGSGLTPTHGLGVDSGAMDTRLAD